MAATYCTYTPQKGKHLFSNLKQNFGYSLAKEVFNRVTNGDFINDFKESLVVDNEGIPTYDSIMNLNIVVDYIGDANIMTSLSKKFPAVEDTRENYEKLVDDAYIFNTTSKYKDKYVAVVNYTDSGKLKVVIKKNNAANMAEYKDQAGTLYLNRRIANIFAPIGITIGNLTEAETHAGRVGVTDFSKARGIATGCASLVKVANNMEGSAAISEEFSHLLIGVFKDDPLVQRSLTVLEENENLVKEILGNEYEDVETFSEGDKKLIAEEALGKILREQLLELSKDKSSKVIFKRALNKIISKFKPFDAEKIYRAIDEIDTLMNTFATEVLNGTRQLTKENVQNSYRLVQFNALSDKIDRSIDILKEIKRNELKLANILNSDTQKEKATEFADRMDYYLDNDDLDNTLGILEYSSNALAELRNLSMTFSGIDNMTPKQKFSFLRSVKMYMSMYGNFVDALSEYATEEDENPDNIFNKEFEDNNGEKFTIAQILKDLRNEIGILGGKYSKHAMNSFAAFIKPFFGDDFVIPYGKRAGEVITVDSLLKEASSDISMLDLWLDSMADSSDTLLQAFDNVVKEAYHSARLKTIEDINHKILVLRNKFEKAGITSFEWVFEKDSDGHKSGNYISEINHAEFAKDLKNLYKRLDEKYGKHPKGKDLKQKILEKTLWLKENSITVNGQPQPNPALYQNKDYEALTDTQKELLEEFLKLKQECDARYPNTKVETLKAIQIRKPGSQRLIESFTSPDAIFTNIKEAVNSALFETEDDDRIFGERAKKGLTDFNGEEFLTLPVLFTNRLNNPDEISTDIIGSLMMYSYASHNFEEIEDVVDALEVGKTLVKETRKVRQTRGNSPLIEKIKGKRETIENKIYKDNSNIEKKLQDFMEGHVYGRYLKDQGTFDILGKKANVNKWTSLLLKGSSLAQLGLNLLANFANVLTGVSMQNIEAVAGQFFNAKELLQADGIYAKNIIPVMSEFGKRNKKNKMSLFFDLIELKQDFKSKLGRVQKKNWLQRIFGSHIAFIGQDAGDHWLYGRTAIAMALREQVMYDGKQMSLWEALQVQDVSEDGSIKELNYKDIKDLEGNPFDVIDFTKRIAEVNQRCFGIYNDADSNAANRVAMGRLLQQYRKWMKVQYNTRFMKGQTNLVTGTWEEGYWRTTARFLKELARGSFQLNVQLKNMHPEEKRNLLRALTELVQFGAVYALANLFEWPDDKKRPWAIKMAEYSARRLQHELGGLMPSPIMLQELLKTVKSPVPAATVVQNALNLGMSITDPRDWTDEIKQGPYKGLSTLEKNFIKAPIPGVAQFKQIDKFIGELDTSITYYTRPY